MELLKARPAEMDNTSSLSLDRARVDESVGGHESKPLV
jgi:hypothetical protein